MIFLLSGGGSSIVEKPIDDEISLDDLIATYRALVHSGAPIAEINAVRKHLSAIKGGRLARAAFPAQQVSLLVSDVPDGTPDALASGPTMPDSTTVEDCHRIAEKYDLLKQFPQSTRELFERHALEETPKSDDPAFQRARWWPLLTNQTAGIEEASVAGRARVASSYMWTTLATIGITQKRPTIWLGACANRRMAILTGLPDLGRGSDGEGYERRSRGPQSAVRAGVRAKGCGRKHHGSQRRDRWRGRKQFAAVGAVADDGTISGVPEREVCGLEARAALEKFDAYPFFKALGDAIEIGPTGNNLRDLRILLAY